MNRLDSDGESETAEECLEELLGGVTFDGAWEEEEADPQSDGPAVTTTQQARRPETIISTKRPISTPKVVDDDNAIFQYAYQCAGYCTPDGRMTRPPLQVVDLGDRGNGLYLTTAVPRGTVLYTERAAVAQQVHKNVQACQYCFRSLEGASALSDSLGNQLPHAELWPVPTLNFVEVSDRLQMD